MAVSVLDDDARRAYERMLAAKALPPELELMHKKIKLLWDRMDGGPMPWPVMACVVLLAGIDPLPAKEAPAPKQEAAMPDLNATANVPSTASAPSTTGVTDWMNVPEGTAVMVDFYGAKHGVYMGRSKNGKLKVSVNGGIRFLKPGKIKLRK